MWQVRTNWPFYLCHTILTISAIFSHIFHIHVYQKTCLHISICHPRADFSKYAEFHTNLLQTQKIWNPKGFNMSPTEDKRKQKKCEINKKVHYSIETQQDFWSERKIARRVEHLSYTKVTSICLQKSIYLIIKNNYSSYSSMLLNWRGFDLQDAQDQFYTQSVCSSTKGITSMQFSLPLNWHLTGKK